LSSFSGDSLEILLSWGVRIANLKEETFFANRLAVELLDNLLADLSGFETTVLG
jgi:hypothetical protein